MSAPQFDLRELQITQSVVASLVEDLRAEHLHALDTMDNISPEKAQFHAMCLRAYRRIVDRIESEISAKQLDAVDK